VVGLAVAGGGAAIAATQLDSPQATSQAIVNDAAQQLGITPTKLSDALKKALENQVDAAVKDGRLTKAEGDALKARIESNDYPLFAGPGLGRGFRGPGAFGHFGHVVGLSAAADYLGLTEAELRMQLESGKSLADVAKAQNKSVDGLVQALYDAAKKDLDAAVSAGKITASQEQTILSGLKQTITNLVNGTAPRLGARGAFGHFGHAIGLGVAADYLGLTEAELQTQLESGKSLADVAKAQNKSVDGLVQALYDAAKKKLDAAVSAGKLTASQEQTILRGLKEMITDLVNSTPPKLGFRAFGPDRFAPGTFPGFRGQGMPRMQEMPRFRAPSI
jgi:urease accessory protein UreF